MTVAPITIRKANLKDLDILLKLSQQLIQYDHRLDPTMDITWPLSPSGRQFFQDRLSHEDSLVLVAELDHDIVGYLIGSKVKADEFRTLSSLADLEEIYILASHRGRAIGSQLWSQFLEWCHSQKLSRISVSVTAANKEAISFYKKAGFKEQYLSLEMEIV